jgi:phosphoribosylglycinamide formyltransferase-1
VIAGNDKKSGVTIHLVNEEYDKGKVLFQKSIPVLDKDTVSSLSKKIHELEYEFFPQIIEKYILNKL